MTLIIRQLVIRGEVVEDSARYSRGTDLNLEKVTALLEATKREIEQEYQERMVEMLENTAAR